MKLLRLIFSTALIASFAACSSQPANKDTEAFTDNPDRIEAYYFHFTARCVTCNTIEAKARENLETLYPNQVKEGLITFRSVNLDDETSKSLAKKLKVSGQALLIVKGKERIDLTNDGFMYAVVKPEKFKEIINEKVDGLLVR